MLPPRLCLSVISVLSASASFGVAALRLDLRGEPIPHLLNRAHISGLDNAQNLRYYTNITLGEKRFSVNIDTGSSDTWVAGTVLNSTDTGVNASIQYAIGGASGRVKFAPLTFLDFTVPDQAYIEVQPSSTNPHGRGLIGLGPNMGSNIHEALKKQPKGDAVLDRIFRQDPSTPNQLTVLLTRSNDSTEQYPGQITVSDILPGREGILDQPKLTVKTVPSSRSGGQHWQTLLDPKGIIGPDGQPIALSTKVSSATNSSQLTVVFDTGFSFNQVPKTVADAIYSRVPEAKFENLTLTGPVWTLPCNAEVNITLLFGNKSFPIHPLDTSFSMTNSTGNKICVGGFQPITTGKAPDYDVILGMVFLRNVYLLINHGDFVDGTPTRAPPYVQLLSVTDTTAAHLDFVNTRLDGADTTGLQVFTEGINSPDDVVSSGDKQSRSILIYGVVSGCLFLLFASVTTFFMLRRQRQRRRARVSAANFSTFDTGLSSGYATYHPLQHAPPPGERDLLQPERVPTEARHASTLDLHAETAYTPLAPIQEAVEGLPPPTYEEHWTSR